MYRLTFRSRPLTLLAALLFASLPASVPAASPSATVLTPSVQDALDAAVTKWLASSGAPGVVLGIWTPGRGRYVVARGYSNIATKSPMRRDEFFRIGSNTKTFTVTVLLQLAGEKKLGLDDPLNKYASFVPNGQNITLRMLANMTSGLFNYTEDKGFVKTLIANPNKSFTPRQLVDIGLSHPPNFKPNTGWHYSNTNTVLLGMIIEKVTGESIADVFAQRIFKPLRLEHTVWPTGGALPEPYAHGITEQTVDGRQADATHWNPSWGFTAGALVSTLDDMRTWVDSYTTGSLIGSALQQQRLTWVTFPPNTSVRKYGLGIGNDHEWLGHTGELPGYNTAGYLLPQKNITVVIMVNSDVPKGGVNPAPALFKAVTSIITPNNVPD